MSSVERTARAVDALRRYWSGRQVVLLLPAFDGAARTLLRELAGVGAHVAGVLSAAAPAPDAPAVDHVWSFAAHGYEVGRAELDTVLRDPPAELVRWLDAVDPDRSALVLGGTFTHLGEVCGRPVHGWRRPDWAAWEDKTRIEQLWRMAGVPSPEHAIVSAEAPDLDERVAELDRGAGVVLAMDASTGFRGDATGLRWLRRAGDLAAARSWFSGRTARLRLATFVPGVPCSILATVLAEGVAVYDPIEIVTLRNLGNAREALVFCGSSTYWRPGAPAVQEMRGHTRAAAMALRSMGFRGMLSVDGILGPQGFLATELNPRHASGLGLRAGWPDFPVYLFQRALQEGLPGVVDLCPQDVEDAFRSTIERHPSYSVRVPASDDPAAGGEHTVWLATAAGPDGQQVRYRRSADRAWVLGIDPVSGDGLAAPAAAALARALGAGDLTSCVDDLGRRPAGLGDPVPAGAGKAGRELR
ncbi:MAG TPA: hypothetical protein VFM55_26430 [Micromonosporaceae bacterium]|nr:hypothetical protein [Micromonosporaceae bacterium]